MEKKQQEEEEMIPIRLDGTAPTSASNRSRLRPFPPVYLALLGITHKKRLSIPYSI
jgi:hypothetical protein